MTKAVLLSYAAIEAVVNEMIESQDNAFTIKHSNAHGEEQELGKAEVVRRLCTPDKLHRVIPEIKLDPDRLSEAARKTLKIPTVGSAAA